MKNKINYDDEEIEILDNFRTGNLNQSKSAELEKKVAKECAENTLEKYKHVYIRLSERDLQKLKIKSLESGISYQTLISVVLHQYIENKIKIVI